MRALRIFARVLRVIGLIALALVALVASLLLHLDVRPAREGVREVLSSFLTDLLAGQVVIDEITRLGTSHVEAKGLVVRDTRGRVVVYAEHVAVDLDLPALLEGTLHLRAATLTGGEVRLLEGEGGSPSLLEAFAPAYEGRPPDPSTGGGLEIAVDDIRAERVRVVGQIVDLTGIVIEDVSASASLASRDTLEVPIRSLRGRLVSPFPFVLAFTADGAISTDPAKGITLDVRAVKGAEAADVTLAFHPALDPTSPPPTDAPLPYANDLERDEGRLDLEVDVERLELTTLAQLGFEWADALTGEARGRVSLIGPSSALAFDAALETSGGPLEVRGEFGEAAVSVDAETSGLDVGAILREAPPARVAGSAGIRIEDTGTGTELTVDVEPIDYQQYVVPAMVIRGTIVDDAILLESAEAKVDGGTVTVNGRIGFDGLLDVNIRARVPDIAGDPNVRRLAPGLRAAVSLDASLARIAETGLVLDVRGSTRIWVLRAGPVRASKVRSRFTVVGQAAWPRVAATIEGEEVVVGSESLGAAEVDIEGGPGAYDVSAILGRGKSRMLVLDGVFQRLRDGFRFDAPHLELIGRNHEFRGSVDGLIYRDGVGYSLDKMTLAAGTERFEASGALRERGEDQLDAIMQNIDVASFVNIVAPEAPPVGGRVDLAVAMRGDLAAPVVTIQGAIRDGSFAELEGVGAVLAASYENATLTVDGAVDFGEGGSLALVVSGFVDATRDDPIEALRGGLYEGSFEANELDLSLVERAVPTVETPVRGRLGGRIRFDGPLEAPSFGGSLHVPELLVGEVAPLDVETTLSYENAVLNARLAVGDGHGALAEAEGSLLLDLVQFALDPAAGLATLELSPWRVALRAPPRALGSWPRPLDASIPPELRSLHASVTATLAGGAFETRGDLHAVLDEVDEARVVGCGHRVRPHLELDARLVGDETSFTAKAFAGGSPPIVVRADIETPLGQWLVEPSARTIPVFDVELEAQRVRADAFPILCDLAKGEFSGNATVEGLFGEAPTLRASFSAPSIQLYDAPPTRALLAAQLSDGRARAALTLGFPRGQRLAARATFPVEWDGGHPVPLIDLEGEFDVALEVDDAPMLSLLTALPSVAAAEGVIDGRVHAHGTALRPVVEGNLEIRRGLVKLVGLGQQLTHISGAIRVGGEALEIVELRARDGDGRARIDGRVQLEGIFPEHAELTLRSDDFPIRQEGSVLARITSNAEIEADIAPDRADASIRARELQITLPDEAPTSVQPLELHPDVVVIGEEPAEADGDPFELRIAIDAREPFWVRRSDFAAQVRSELHVRMREPDVRVSGYIEIRRGYFEVFGKRFDVDRASVRFTGGTSIDPDVNLVASHAIRGTNETVTVTVSGRLSEPSIEFTASSGERDRAEVIALLVTGRTTLFDSSSGDEEQRAGAQATAFLAGLAGAVLTLTARQEFGDVLPDLSVDNCDDGSGVLRPCLRAGFEADWLIPKFLRGIVRGAYVEGFFTAATSGDASRTQATSTGQRRDNSFLLELQFPYNIVNTNTFAPPTNWSVDFTWEP